MARWLPAQFVPEVAILIFWRRHDGTFEPGRMAAHYSCSGLPLGKDEVLVVPAAGRI